VPPPGARRHCRLPSRHNVHSLHLAYWSVCDSVYTSRQLAVCGSEYKSLNWEGL
jgi:hypothetical protein